MTHVAQSINQASTQPTFVHPAFHGQMLATWHSFGDGLFYPALVGWMGSEVIGSKLIYVVPQEGVLSGFATWQEARDVAALAKRLAGACLYRIDEVA